MSKRPGSESGGPGGGDFPHQASGPKMKNPNLESTSSAPRPQVRPIASSIQIVRIPSRSSDYGPDRMVEICGNSGSGCLRVLDKGLIVEYKAGIKNDAGAVIGLTAGEEGTGKGMYVDTVLGSSVFFSSIEVIIGGKPIMTVSGPQLQFYKALNATFTTSAIRYV